MVSLEQGAAPKGAAVPTLRELTSGELFSVLAKYKRQLSSVALFSGAINLLYLAPAIYMLQIYDRVLTSQSESTLIALTVLVFGFFVITGMLEGVRGNVMSRLGEALDDDLSAKVYRATFSQQLRVAGNQGSQPLWDLQSVRQFFSGSGLSALLDLPWLPIFLVAIFMLDPRLGWFVLLGSVALFITAFATERLARKPLAQANQCSMAATGVAASQLRNAEVVFALGMLPRLTSRWRALQLKARDFQRQALGHIRITGGFTRVLRMMLQSGTLGLGAWLALKGELTPGAMIAAAILATRALSPLETVISHWKSFLGTMESAGRLNQLLIDFPEPVKGMEIPRPAGKVTAENIFVSSPSNKHFILKGLSFTLSPREVLGILGPSAAGKSTLARALVGVWPAQLGVLRFDGSDFKNLQQTLLGSAIGYLPQDIELFSGTVAENIARFGEPNSEAVIAAANACGIHGMMLNLPKGYDTPIGEAGTMLSGGQRQLIALARAVYEKPSLIVLDEPSSNLDEIGKKCLARAIESMKSWESTVVVISHDPSVLKLADRLMLLQDGQIRSLGPTSEMLGVRRSTKKGAEHAGSH
jgi:ATP-binding cassette, subfamily C, bacterial exporter for protease/lipase